MRTSTIFSSVFYYAAALAVLQMAGCGGGAGGGEDGAVPNAQAEAPAVKEKESFLLRYPISIGEYPGCAEDSGVISLLSTLSIITPCIDSAAVVTVDGKPFAVAGIQDGSIAVVEGTRTPGSGVVPESIVATSIDVQRAVVGTIESLDLSHARFSALGQLVYVSSYTKVSGGGTIDALAVGERIVVSGYFSADGEILATAIGIDSDAEGFLLRGILQQDASGGAFRIGQMTLDLSNAVVEGFPGGVYARGDAVLAYADDPPIDDVLPISSLQFIGADWSQGPEDIRLLTGVISDMPAPYELVVEGRRIDCAFFPCAHLTEARIGNLVGVAQGDWGDPTAIRVLQLQPASDDVLVVGEATAVDAQNGALEVLGFPIQILPATVVVDEIGRPDHPDDIQVGDTVSVVAGPVDETLIAGRIVRYTPFIGPPPPQIATRIAVFAAPDIHVLGTTILTDETTAVYEDCVGQQDLEWLFDVASESTIYWLNMQVVPDVGGEISAIRIDVDAGSCYGWWDY